MNDDQRGRANDTRRRFVKGAALGAGGMTLSQWTRPIVEKVVLPAHAQTTGPAPGGPRITQAGSGQGLIEV